MGIKASRGMLSFGHGKLDMIRRKIEYGRASMSGGRTVSDRIQGVVIVNLEAR